MKDFLIETSSQRKEINWNKMSSFYQNNNSSLIDAFHNAKSLNFQLLQRVANIIKLNKS